MIYGRISRRLNLTAYLCFLLKFTGGTSLYNLSAFKMVLSPWLKSPFTDLSGALTSHQWGSECANLEMKALDCLEAYGLNKGHEKCTDLIDDFKECSLRFKQNQRILAMREERNRQYTSGERSKENRYAEGPAPDSY